MNLSMHHTPKALWNIVWDVTWVVSLVGIWPRYVEPNLLSTTKIRIPIRGLPQDLRGLRIVHLSDLHLSPDMPDRFLEKIICTSRDLKPDLILFTGDFLCYGRLDEPDRLVRFLNRFSARFGCFAVLGNHDYESYVGVNPEGDYDTLQAGSGDVAKAFRRILTRQTVTGKFSQRLQSCDLHSGLVEVFKQTPFVLLENACQKLAIGHSFINICGLGEYSARRCLPELAFQHYDARYPGIVLAHNPDTLPHLSGYPGELVLCGHIHGGQINLPWIVDRFAVVEHPEFRKGLIRSGGRTMYVSRGLGGVLRLRWRARPELVAITLEG